MKELNEEYIKKLVSENPNNMELGSKIRQYVRNNTSVKPYNNPDQLSLDLNFDDGEYVDVDEEAIDLGEATKNLNKE